MRNLSFVFLLVVSSTLANLAAGAPVVYTGFDVSFAKEAFGDVSLPANQDQILSDVSLTRGSSRGIYNIAQEDFFTDNSSPAGTTWAFASNNPTETVSATNWSNLVFEDWQTALGSAGNLNVNILASNGVLHLVDHDIYLDIHFTDWGTGAGSGGSFAYERSALVPEPTGLLLLSCGALMYTARSRFRLRTTVTK